ncbi:MAG TPA: 2-amino-4-hydroxy-6-hydroxymethyldihydropteridine diphosphokinase [Steroidobacteraceae bacterium]|jgi:2-amino-4-hydroxy-6-hydroxymethyldihydropteridine diphosphokinase|nr:2-amino-4-hydroxy-6-hydroxymethyldihydropteridine diphosphokinase [Steroidobacteraceae bacterium]
MAHWRPAYVAIGSNLDHPRERVLEACAHLQSLADTRLEARSSLYRTHPMGPQDQPEFINAAVGLLTQMRAHRMLEALLEIERRMGRIREERWGPRVIDLDLIWMAGPPIEDPSLTLPHPGVSSRNFVLYPLADIAPSLDLPGHGRVLDLKLRAGAQGIAPLEGASRQ